jgi:hypothetical protein
LPQSEVSEPDQQKRSGVDKSPFNKLHREPCSQKRADRA